jgi:CheY-like chemotaxis protein
VLYVDDDEVMLSMVEHLLRKLGYRATCMVDPRTALAEAKAGNDPYDIVVTDFNMPHLSGLDLARALHEALPHLPVVISSGFIPEQLRIDAQAAGVVALIRKEHTLDDLATVVERALAGTGLQSHGPSG